jgi:hypothetical protein
MELVDVPNPVNNTLNRYFNRGKIRPDALVEYPKSVKGTEYADNEETEVTEDILI